MTEGLHSNYPSYVYQAEIILTLLLEQLGREVKSGPENDTVASLLKSVQALEKLNAILAKMQKKDHEDREAQKKSQAQPQLTDLDWEIIERHIEKRRQQQLKSNARPDYCSESAPG